MSVSTPPSFNSRTPGGVRHRFNPFRLLAYQFQFTHPGRGATRISKRSHPFNVVSIHAPREGCDSVIMSSSDNSEGFNSRTPGGVRLPRTILQVLFLVFQFTHPGRGATGFTKRTGKGISRFNSRTPGGVRLTCFQCLMQGRICFNSRTPGGVRLPSAELTTNHSRGFNSRTPGGVRQ